MNNEYILKRIVAVENDIQKNSKVTINGVELFNVRTQNDITYKIPPNSFFILGDNYEVSIDSRNFGLITVNSIIGKPLYIIKIGRE